MLKNSSGGTKEFAEDHAENILRTMEKSGLDHWKLPKDSEFKFENGKFYTRAGDTKAKKSQKREGA